MQNGRRQKKHDKHDDMILMAPDKIVVPEKRLTKGETRWSRRIV